MTHRVLTITDFAPHRGQAFGVQTAQGSLPLLLVQAQELPGSIRDGGGFRLEFHGPLQPALGQGMYRMQIGGQPTDIFIVPIGTTPQQMRYEAIFF